MVSTRRTASHWLLITAIGLVLFTGAAAPLEKSPPGNPGAHRTDSAVKRDDQADPQAEKAKRPLATVDTKPKAPVDTQSGSGDSSPKHEEERPKWTDKAQAISSVVVMFFTLALTVVAFMQNRLEKKLAEDTAESIALAKQSADAATKAANAAVIHSEAAAQSNRAWMIVNELKTVAGHHEGRLSAALLGIQWKNMGNTPSFRCCVGINTHWVKQPDNSIPTAVANDITENLNATIGPGAVVNTADVPIQPIEIAYIESGVYKLYIGTFCTYTDFWGNIRRTEAFYLMHIQGSMDCGNGIQIPAFRMSAIGPQNTAT
jgi:hypothetical protein